MPSPQAWVTASRSTATPDSSVGDGVLGRSGVPGAGGATTSVPASGIPAPGVPTSAVPASAVPASDPASVADAVSLARLIAPTEALRPTPSGWVDVSTGGIGAPDWAGGAGRSPWPPDASPR